LRSRDSEREKKEWRRREEVFVAVERIGYLQQ
jgi:hypothetical protein